MTQSQQNNESWTGMHDFMAVGRARADAMAKAQAELRQQFEALQQAWLGHVKLHAESVVDLVKRCSKCSNPGEAAGLYNEWLGERIEALFAGNRHLADQWLHLFDTAIAPLKAAQAAANGKPVEAEAAEAAAEAPARSRAARA